MPAENPQRWSAAKKAGIVVRRLKGESLDAVSREIQQPASKLAGWRGAFLTGAEAVPEGRSKPDEQEALRDERLRLRAKVGELAMDNELLLERCHKLEAGLPPAQRRSRR